MTTSGCTQCVSYDRMISFGAHFVFRSGDLGTKVRHEKVFFSVSLFTPIRYLCRGDWRFSAKLCLSNNLYMEYLKPLTYWFCPIL